MNNSKKFVLITGEKNVNWKGKNVGYGTLHKWVERRLGISGTCEGCDKRKLSGHQIHWANLSGKYKRDTNDWKRLCASCHALHDGRSKKIYYKGIEDSPSNWSKFLKMKRRILCSRIYKYNWDIEKAFFTPIRTHNY